MNGQAYRRCVFAGTFDPPTLGHEAIVRDCLQLFDEVVVAVLTNPSKTPYFSIEERMAMLATAFATEPRVRIIAFSGTATELLRRENTKFYMRGIRNGVDLDYENALFYANKKLDKDMIAVYLPCPQELLHVSSSMAKNCLRFRVPIDEYVSESVKTYIETRERNKSKV